MKVLYFTATGNSLYIAKAFDGELISISQAIKEQKYDFKDEVIGIVFPSYGCATPTFVKEFLKKANFDCKYLFGIVTYGMIAAGTTSDLKNIDNLDFSYINTIKMIDNYLPTFEMGSQISSEVKKDIEENLSKIVSDINNQVHYIPKKNFISRKFTNNSAKHGKYNLGITDKFKVEDTCITCGICAKVCPVDNIIINNKPEFQNYCVSCLACTHNCPTNCIRLTGEKSNKRYRNKNITLDEIVIANN